MRSTLRFGLISIALALLGFAFPGDASCAPSTAEQLDQSFAAKVKPFLTANCLACHGDQEPDADLDLSQFPTVESVATDHPRWELVLERLTAGDMPPEEADAQPTAEQRAEVIAWIKALRAHEGQKNAGDPGSIPVRRLSNAEYNYTIRDLTGVDIQPTKDFPVDPANEAGFDNSAASISTSPALVKKYLDSARNVANHLALTPTGFVFAPHEVISHTDRDKFCVNRIVDFYKRQPTDYSDYFLAAWKYKNRQPSETLDDLAAEAGISGKYLQTIWETLNGQDEPIGPIAALRSLWNSIPADATPEKATAICDQMEAFVADLRPHMIPKVDNLTSPQISPGSQPLVIWKNEQMAANHTKYADGSALKLEKWKLPADSQAREAMEVPEDAAEREKYEADCRRFCAIFPDAFYVSERGRVWQNEASRGRLLSAGFHNQQGYFRDDTPLSDLLLDEAGQQALDQLWDDFDLVCTAPQRQYRSFIWYERAESKFLRDEVFDSFRSEDKDSITDAKMQALEKVYLEKAVREGASDTARQAIVDYFASMNQKFRAIEESLTESESAHLVALQEFAARAFRRPVTPAEQAGIVNFYQHLRAEEQLSHEDAIRDCVVSVLMSPKFFFHLGTPAQPSAKAVPLDDYALANRLSYFLWRSMPDAELLQHAAAGDLHQPEVLIAQAKRMSADPKIRGMAVEFGGNWLDFRRFEEHNAVDRERFPTFDNDLRQAMFEEPIHFFTDLAERDGSVLDFLYGDYTFVNKPLADHYGIPFSGNDPEEWIRLDEASQYGRGGLLPMSVFLTKNAPGLRTSPVKRGYWVAKRVLGEHIPAPPADVPELPADESKSELSLREALAKHRELPSCAGCHKRFDSLGVVFEGYGPVGEQRSEDLGGRPVETSAEFPDGSAGDGLIGLTNYIRERRQEDFLDNLNRKLLAYALGRTLQLSDEKLLHEMQSKLASNDYRFSVLLESIVTSPQFLNQRGAAVTQ
ncbi:DUF1592 domain-containing protein [Blastopirellula sp. JC732]|uniref:DUF1592 domain-containing protein n=1 Tax=Blastopirellula sediminis TaxID=2894196 RepID=A0A9X1MLK7_9BACT|nr:DUF1592 domain-containing protein [Blastopirellula sediminis]MCC9608354.1 DUF1592 domain-containing protein [Blastopirellula sediminis]MCC9628869.1 DUF1592 domain-containing protein [Blastopirellula sediminis]